MHLKIRKYKYGLLAQPFLFFQNIWRHFVESQRGFLLLAVLDDKILAGDLFLQWKDTLYYKFNASIPEDLSHRPNDLLIWEAIQQAKKQGLQFLDFGLSDFDQEGLVGGIGFGVLGGEFCNLLAAHPLVRAQEEMPPIGKRGETRRVARQHLVAEFLELEVCHDLGAEQAVDVGTGRNLEAGPFFFGHSATAFDMPFFENGDLQARFGQVSRGDESVVAGSDDNRVVDTGPALIHETPPCLVRLTVSALARLFANSGGHNPRRMSHNTVFLAIAPKSRLVYCLPHIQIFRLESCCSMKVGGIALRVRLAMAN